MQGSRGQDALYNFISVVMVGFTVLVVIAVLLILTNPDADYNPFPPGEAGGAALPTAFRIPTSTPTPEQPILPPTWTASPSPTGGPSVTPSLTATVTATPTVTSTKVFTPTASPSATPTGPTATLTPIQSAFPYVLQAGTPDYTSYFANTSAGCNWAGLAGQVFNSSGFGKVGVRVHVFGSGIDEYSVSGSYADTYGSGGWEVNVHVKPVVRTFTVRVEDSAGKALSEDVVVTTRDTCEENLVIINFQATS